MTVLAYVLMGPCLIVERVRAPQRVPRRLRFAPAPHLAVAATNLLTPGGLRDARNAQYSQRESPG